MPDHPDRNQLEESKGKAVGNSGGVPEAGDGHAQGSNDDYVRRRYVFLMLCVAVVCIGFVVLMPSLRGGPDYRLELPNPRPSEGSYTVKLLEVPVAKRELVDKFTDNPTVRSLASGHELFTLRSEDGSSERLMLCVGRFSSKDSPRLKELLGRFRDFGSDGRKVFRSAVIYRYSP